MKRTVCGVWLLASLAACDDSTQPAEPSSTPPTAAAAVAVAQQFTVRDLGTLGGTISHANSINEQGEVAGVAQNAAGQPRAFLWRADRVCGAWARWEDLRAGLAASTTEPRWWASARSIPARP